jgi:glycosyltransferase
MATGDVVGFLNADDFCANTSVLEKVSSVFESPAVKACYGDLVYVKDDVRYIKEEDSENLILEKSKIVRYWRAGPFNPHNFYWGWMPPHPTFFVRRVVYEKFGDFSLSLGSSADYELMLRFLLRKQIKCEYIPEIMVKMRIGGVSNASVKSRLKAHKMDRKAWKINDLKPYPWTLPLKPIRKLSQWWRRPT